MKVGNTNFVVIKSLSVSKSVLNSKTRTVLKTSHYLKKKLGLLSKEGQGGRHNFQIVAFN